MKIPSLFPCPCSASFPSFLIQWARKGKKGKEREKGKEKKEKEHNADMKRVNAIGTGMSEEAGMRTAVPGRMARNVEMDTAVWHGGRARIGWEWSAVGI